MATEWKVEVDWNRDGAYSEITDYVTEARWFLGFRAPFMGTASEAYLHLKLANADKRFSPENSAGPLSDQIIAAAVTSSQCPQARPKSHLCETTAC